MAYIVEMVRGNPGTLVLETHSCTGIQWEGLLRTAKTFGWVPQGTIPDESALNLQPDYMDVFTPDYEPNEWPWCKRFSEKDAHALSDALLRFSKSLIMQKLREPETETVSGGRLTAASSPEPSHLSVPDCVDAFLSYVVRGGFAFAQGARGLTTGCSERQ